MVLAVVMPARALTSSLAPKRWQKVGLAVDEFSRYMQEILEQERVATENEGAIGSSQRRSKSLTSALIQASEEDKATEGKGSAKGLSDEEVYGNMFIFNFAGQDTTANTMAYAIALMAIHPEIQEWARAEVVDVFSQNNPREYDQVFPRLKRLPA
ncbi:putative cytochrome p450 monooxygenase [Diaporthe ampelina]|uniref:Putative cytochrome p450 monooxygenase n=1 Tax=Diaporthe ampelina TaxID=1214573 RepID=A0A0G2FHA8_9PEZI|nr:putative cytochrome p450 monooxygenase [Diaporthe ampelina]